MSEPSQSFEGENEGPEVEGAELQFDQAEPAAPHRVDRLARACNRPIEDQYFEINGKVICTSCRQHIEASLPRGLGSGPALQGVTLWVGCGDLGCGDLLCVRQSDGCKLESCGDSRRLHGWRGGAKGHGQSRWAAVPDSGFAADLLCDWTDGARPWSLRVQSKSQGKTTTAAKPRPGRPRRTSPRKRAEPNTPVVAPDRRPVAEEKTDAVTPKKQEGAGAQQELPQNVGPVTALLLLSAVFAFVTAASPVYHAIQSPISGLIY